MPEASGRSVGAGVVAALGLGLLAASCRGPDIVLDLRGGVAGSCEAAGGVCMPAGPPPNWKRPPLLLWYGHSYNIPPGNLCPDEMLGEVLYRDPLPPYGCPLCTCGDPA